MSKELIKNEQELEQIIKEEMKNLRDSEVTSLYQTQPRQKTQVEYFNDIIGTKWDYKTNKIVEV